MLTALVVLDKRAVYESTRVSLRTVVLDFEFVNRPRSRESIHPPMMIMHCKAGIAMTDYPPHMHGDGALVLNVV
jgi:hypothetical protein